MELLYLHDLETKLVPQDQFKLQKETLCTLAAILALTMMYVLT